MATESSAARPTETIEDYLQTIYSLETEGEKVISARLARWMRVTPPTAWSTVQRMHRDGMVDIDEHKVIRLTDHGRALAESVARRHRISERFLNDILGLGWAEAHLEAHHFEHGMTPVIEERIIKLLGNPTTCPHGSPIPGTGAVLDPNARAIDSFEIGDRIIIKFISEELEEDSDMLRYLERHEVKPNQEFLVTEKEHSLGLVILEQDSREVSLSIPVASRIRAIRSS
jgi:DtxR family transcriptional regulator, iron-dependent repressor